MTSFKLEKRKLNRIYHDPKDNIYKFRLYRDLSSVYSFRLGDKTKLQSFYDFEPHNCKLREYLKKDLFHDFDTYFDGLTSRLVYNLLAYGRAFLYIIPHYEIITNENGEKEQILSSININELRGLVKKRERCNLIFCVLAYDGSVHEIKMSNTQLITFDLKDIGFRRNYFSYLVKKLGKYDILSSKTMMNYQNIWGYDLLHHKKKNKLEELKLLKDIGWSFNTDELSDSYILYKEIQIEKLRIKILEYVIKQMNDCLNGFIQEKNCGKITVNIRERDYKKIWDDYSEGRMSTKKLTDLLI